MISSRNLRRALQRQRRPPADAASVSNPGVQSVRYRPVTVLKIINSDTGRPTSKPASRSRASARRSSTSRFRRPPPPTGLTFAGNVTLTALADRDQRPGQRLVGPGRRRQRRLRPLAIRRPLRPAQLRRRHDQSRAHLTARGQFAELKMHTYELAGYQFDPPRLAACVPSPTPIPSCFTPKTWFGLSASTTSASSTPPAIPPCPEACRKRAPSWSPPGSSSWAWPGPDAQERGYSQDLSTALPTKTCCRRMRAILPSVSQPPRVQPHELTMLYLLLLLQLDSDHFLERERAHAALVRSGAGLRPGVAVEQGERHGSPECSTAVKRLSNSGNGTGF